VKHQIITVNNAAATTLWLFFPAKTIIIKIGFARAGCSKSCSTRFLS
jgi:hypothetical protein